MLSLRVLIADSLDSALCGEFQLTRPSESETNHCSAFARDMSRDPRTAAPNGADRAAELIETTLPDWLA